MVGALVVLAFLFGYEIAMNKDKLSYDLYKFTNGNVDWVEAPPSGPADRISEDQIYVLRDKIEIDIQNPS